MKERKEILLSVKSNYGEIKKGIDKRISYLKGMNILNGSLFIISGGVLIITILSELLGYNFFKWNKMGIMAILSLAFILRLPKDILELKLLNHYKKIENVTFENKTINLLNNDLANIIGVLNKGIHNNIIIIICAIGIMFMGIWLLYDENTPYWNYMKIPVLVFYVIILVDYLNINTKISANIKNYYQQQI